MVYRPKIDEQLCFVLMPFQELFVEYFRGIIAPAAAEVGLVAKKADDIFGTRPIIQDIWDSIWSAKAVIADVTGKNPNVNYELGVCHSLGVPTVLITQDLNDVPFDYRHRRCIRYDLRRVDWQDKLKREIVATLKAVLAGEGNHEDLRWPYDTVQLNPARKIGSFVSAEEAMEPILRGISSVRDSVITAYGPHGNSIQVSRRFGDGRGDRSGTLIAEATDSADPIERQGIDRVRALARELSATVGDGSKTAIVLFRELIAGGFQALRDGARLRELISDMNIAVDKAVEFLNKMNQRADTGDVFAVAQTAAGGDSLSGHIVHEAIQKSGADGLIYVQESPDTTSSVTVRQGMYFDRGFISPDFITDDPKQLAVLSDPYILLYTGRILSMRYLLPILEPVAVSGRALLLVAEDVDGEALATLTLNKKRGTLSCAAVRSPGFQQTRQVLMEDIGVATGGMIIDGSERVLEQTGLRQLGQAVRVEVSKDSTWIIGGRGDQPLINSRAAALRQQIERTHIDIEKERLQARLAQLVGSTCSIQIGGVSSVDREERKYRIQTAMHSTQSAVAFGVVPGGGAALWHAQKQLTANSPGFRIVAASLRAPTLAQIKNARVNEAEILKRLDASTNVNDGFNAETKLVDNLRKNGVQDATKTTISALQLAFSHARAVLQVGAWDLTEQSPRDEA